MKKILILLGIFVLVPVSALNADNLLEESKTVEESLKNAIVEFDNWSKEYNTNLEQVFTIENMNTITVNLTNEEYDEVIEFIYNKLDGNAKVGFPKDKILSSIDSYFEFKNNLKTFVKNNSKALNIVTGTNEGIDISFELYEQLQKMYAALKNPLITLLNDIADPLSNSLSNQLDEIKVKSDYELLIEFNDKEDFLENIVLCISSFDTSLNEYEEIFTIIATNDKLFESVFKNKLKNDFSNLIENFKDKMLSNFDEFINTRNNVEKDFVRDVINSSLETNEKNQKLSTKIKSIKSIKKRINEKIDSLILQTNFDFVQNILEDIKLKIDNEFYDEIEYIEKNFIVDDYDIILVDNHDEKISIDRINEIIILEKAYDLEAFKDQLEVASLGTLEFDEEVATKTRVIVKDDENIKKTYTVVVRGDVNSNGSITITDAIIAAYKSLGSTELDEYEILAADMNSNDNITITDAYIIAMNALNQGGE